MPLEKRDPVSKARLFVPTARERSLVQSQRLLDAKLEEIEKLEKKLNKLIEKMDNEDT
ncbi:hypothetical protein Bp8pC_098 [Bacillus phage Bp8p-C]|uniref:Uncharacterized protein n=2 Tax=Agatevirus Bp8pC TaxID=1910937 RepID=A0A0A0PQL8_9CAUD|nr:hypothetical protein AXJ20_gp098 [Bacillus phage Bp8p-C]YP_009784399.1 hypothetical protein QLX39_gp098 [Bacillus phage Bp8p-T]AHJ87529.1 hypothetical protein Bp8pC_098 [Bacillus phage Bp8p-C]AHJ87740.1 hypothetical protein Bp8pT_098 [Bacillus phage Bp8p-T]